MRWTVITGILVASAVLAAVGALRYPLSDDDAVMITLAEAERLDPVLWVDARAQAKSSPPGFVRMTLDDWEGSFDALFAVWDPDGHVVVVCESSGCTLSTQIARRLRDELGVDSVHALREGWDAVKHQPTP